MNSQQKPYVAPPSLPYQVKEGAAFVAAAADSVRIRYSRIEGYVADLLKKYPVITRLDTNNHFVSEASPAATANYVLALDSINFGSGYFELAQSLDIPLDYNHIAGCLKKAFTESRLNTPVKWLGVTAAECHDVFGVPADAHAALDWLMASFADHLGATGQLLTESYDGDVMNLLESAHNSAVRLVEIMGAEPAFRDIAIYKGVEVPLFKRAQILAADLQLALQGRTPAAFTDMDELTSFADNMVPHVLRCDGILDYAPSLASLIDNDHGLLDPGAPEETEIRACAVHAVELMKEAAQRQGSKVTSVNLDHILWNRGAEPEIASKPTHRTLTVWY